MILFKKKKVENLYQHHCYRVFGHLCLSSPTHAGKRENTFSGISAHLSNQDRELHKESLSANEHAESRILMFAAVSANCVRCVHVVT